MIAASVQLSAPQADSAALIMGRSAGVCAFLILFLALPVFGGLFLSLRQLAPTRLTLAGAAAGLAAGGWAAGIYCFHCMGKQRPLRRHLVQPGNGSDGRSGRPLGPLGAALVTPAIPENNLLGT